MSSHEQAAPGTPVLRLETRWLLSHRQLGHPTSPTRTWLMKYIQVPPTGAERNPKMWVLPPCGHPWASDPCDNRTAHRGCAEGCGAKAKVIIELRMGKAVPQRMQDQGEGTRRPGIAHPGCCRAPRAPRRWSQRVSSSLMSQISAAWVS